MFKKMKPEEFKVGRRYRTNYPGFEDLVYEYRDGIHGLACYRAGGYTKAKANYWEWEEIKPPKKRIFR